MQQCTPGIVWHPHWYQKIVFRIRIRIWSGFNQVSMEKLPTKIAKKKEFHGLKCWCSLLRAEGFSCSLDVLYEGLGISKLQFLSKNIHFIQLYMSPVFGHQNPELDLDPDPDPDSMNPDPKHCKKSGKSLLLYKEFRRDWVQTYGRAS